MEDLPNIELTLDMNHLGASSSHGYAHMIQKGTVFAASNNEKIKGLCDIFLREKRKEKDASNSAATFQTVEVKQQASKKITAQKKFAGQKNTYNKYSNKNWMQKNKGNRQTGKKQKMNIAKNNIQNALYKKEMKAKAKAFKETALTVNPRWPLVETIQPITLSNLPKFKPGTSEVIFRAGKIAEFKYQVDSALSSKPIKFSTFSEIPEERFSTQNIQADPNIAKCVEAIEGKKIVASDMAIATLMNIPKAYYSWDLKITKTKDVIYIGKRDKDEKEEFVFLDLEMVGENSITPPPANAEEFKGPSTPANERRQAALRNNTAMNLMKEGTKILHSVQNVAIDKEGNVQTFEKNHPIQEAEDQQGIPFHGYTYMRWPFGDGRTLITRGQLHSYEDMSGKGDEDSIKYSNIYAMNQWKFNKPEWDKIDADKAAVLGGELTDNNNRVSKWALQSLFAGADNMKIVFVKRQKLFSNLKQQIIGCSTVSTYKFLNLISFQMESAWSNVKFIADYFSKQEDGEYIIVRDPIKNVLKIFNMEEQEGEEDDEF